MLFVAWAPAQAISFSQRAGASHAAVDDSARAALRRLRAVPAKKRTRKQRALIAGLAFCDAVRRASGVEAYKQLDVVGYQPLPLEGELPEAPGKPITPSALAKRIDDRPAARAGKVPAELFVLTDRETLRKSYPAVARWMLPRDFALVIERPDGDSANWVARRCCIVIRLRGKRASIVGGNLFEALKQSREESAKQPPARGAVDSPAASRPCQACLPLSVELGVTKVGGAPK